MKKRITSILVALTMCLSLLPGHALAAEITTPPHTCTDAAGDYYCDECREVILHDCIDEDGDHSCDLCGEGIYPSVSDLNFDVVAEDGQFIVTWQPLEDVGEDKVVSYTVYCYEEGGSYDAAIKEVYTSDQQVFTHTFTDLEFDVAYKIGVCAEYESGFSADQSTTEALYALWVGSTQVTSINNRDVFDDGTVSYDPESDTLTLDGYRYEGDGYLYSSDETDIDYSAAIYSTSDLNIELVGENSLDNTFTVPGSRQYGDGVYVKGSLSLLGPGTLLISGDYGISSRERISITDCTVYINASYIGIYAMNGLSITDSVVDIIAEYGGIYSYGGGVTINCTAVSPHQYLPSLTGTKLTIINKKGLPLTSDIQPLVISDNLTISVPEGGKVKRFNGRFDEDGDGIKEDYVYDAIVDADGNKATSVTIKPLGYHVSTTGLLYDMSVLVPAGQSMNEAYRDIYDIEDFSALLDTEKENYIFVGWYTDPTFAAGSEYSFDTPVSGDITIYPRWVYDSPSDSGSSGGSFTPTYAPTIEQVQGGAVSTSPKRPEAGDTVTITPKPDSGMVVNGVTVSNKQGDAVDVTDNGDGTFSFVQPKGKVTISAQFICGGGEGCPGHSFDDVDTGAWYHAAVDYVLENQLMQGVGGGSFAPDGTTTRAMVWTVLAKLDGVDTAGGASWYEAAQKWAMQQGISDGSNPDGAITREQFVTMLYAYAKYNGLDVSVGENTNILSYEDASDISEWAIPAVQWACGSGLMEGDGVKLMPIEKATRAQSAALLASFCQNIK